MRQSERKKQLLESLVGLFRGRFNSDFCDAKNDLLSLAIVNGHQQKFLTNLNLNVSQVLDGISRLVENNNKIAAISLLIIFFRSIESGADESGAESEIQETYSKLLDNRSDQSFFLPEQADYGREIEAQFQSFQAITHDYIFLLKRLREAIDYLTRCCGLILGTNLAPQSPSASPVAVVTSDDLFPELRPAFDTVAGVIAAMNRFGFYKMLICLCRVLHLSICQRRLELRCRRLSDSRNKFLQAYKTQLLTNQDTSSQSLRVFLGEAENESVFQKGEKNRLVGSVFRLERKQQTKNFEPTARRLSFSSEGGSPSGQS